LMNDELILPRRSHGINFLDHTVGLKVVEQSQSSTGGESLIGTISVQTPAERYTL
jgi:hypothetical protein